MISSKYLEGLKEIRDYFGRYLGKEHTQFQENTQVTYLQTNRFRCRYDKCPSKDIKTGALHIQHNQSTIASDTFGIHRECIELLFTDPRIGSLN
ncbi:MAG: hypothetical protein ABIB47_03700 [Candidatus Woesearchaeota archaeon]